MDVLPEAVDLSAATETGISAGLGASSATSAAALLSVLPMGLDGDSAQFAEALNAAGAAYLGAAAEHVGERVSFAGSQTIASLTYQATDAITAATNAL